MLSDKMTDALNGQLNAEMYSSYLYLSMAAYFESLNLKGSAHWMRAQAQEELLHSMKFFEFIKDRQGRIKLRAIADPPTEWDSPLAVFEHVASHEAHVTGLIHGLVTVATDEKDHATRAFLQWFVTEQVEEEAGADEVVQKLRLIAGDNHALLMLDQELGLRLTLFTLPIAPAP
jgi:ferritin